MFGVKDFYGGVVDPTFDGCWNGNTSLGEFLRLFGVYDATSSGDTLSSAAMYLVVRRSHILLSPVLYHWTMNLVARDMLIERRFKPFCEQLFVLVPAPIDDKLGAFRVFEENIFLQRFLITTVLLHWHSYPAARGWARMAKSHMFEGDAAILEIMLDYVQRCDYKGILYLLGQLNSEGQATESGKAPEELQCLFSEIKDERRLESAILKVFAIRAPEEFLFHGYELASTPRNFEFAASFALRSAVLSLTPDEANKLRRAKWLTPRQQLEIPNVHE